MATDIVGSLFGVTPEMLQQRQFEMADRQAQEYAQMTPLQRASYGLARGGYQLAGALGGEDPQLRMASTRNAIARQIDPTDPQSMMRGIQALQQAGDQVGAMQLAQVLRQVEGDLAQRFQRQAAGEASLASARRERVQATPDRIQIAREYASTFGGEGTPEYMQAYRASLRGEEKPERPVVVGNTLVNPTTGAVIYQSPTEKLDTVVVGGNLVDKATGRVIFTAPETQQRPVVVGNSLVNSTTGDVIYTSPSGKLDTAVVDGNLVDKATGRVIFTAPEKATKPVVVGNALVNPDSGAIIYQSQTDKLDTAVVNGNLVDKATGRVIFTAPEGEGRPVVVGQSLVNPRTGEVIFTEPRADRQQSFGTDREAVSRELYSKPFGDLTQPEQAAVNRRLEQEQAKRAPSITNVMPGTRQLADIPAFRSSVQKTIEPQLKSIDAADQALQAIDDSIRTNNFVSFNAARVQLAKALGDSQLSRRDVEQAGGDPSLIGGLYDTTSRLFTGTPSLDTQNKIKDTLNAIRVVASRKANDEVNVQRRIALQTPGYDAAAVDRALSFPQLQQRATATGASSLADQARAELARRQAGGK